MKLPLLTTVCFLMCIYAEGQVFLNISRSIQGYSFTHDLLRHGRYLANVDIPLGGYGIPTHIFPYYFTKLRIGSPAKDYYLCVDTGSDLTWLGCDHKTLYSPKKSTTAQIVQCDYDLCDTSYNHDCFPGQRCNYEMSYGDGSASTGYLVRDMLQLDVVSGNFATSPVNSSIVVGCAVQEAGNLKQQFGASIDGIIGFGQAELGFMSQIATSVPIQKTFAHCFDNSIGGGVFLIGQVETLKVKTTPLVQKRKHYTVNMEAIRFGDEILQLLSGNLRGLEAVIDSGSTLAYLPKHVYEPLMNKIISNHHDLRSYRIEQNPRCFNYNASIDAGFPTITLDFEGSLQLVVYPHDYLYTIQDDTYCIGWRESGDLSRSLQDIAVLGDLVLANKFVVYDVGNQAIGWTEYDCTSSVGVQDGRVGAQSLYTPPHIISAGLSNDMGSIMIMLAVLFSSLLFF